MNQRARAREATHRTVQAAATALFLERGYAATTVRDIAQQAGVSAGTVIGVGDKSALLATTLDALLAKAVPDGASAPDGDQVAVVMARLAPYLDFFATHRGLARQYGAILMSGTHSGEELTSPQASLRADLHSALRASGHAADHAERVSVALHLACLGAVFAWAASGLDDAATARADLQTAVSVILGTADEA